MVVREEQFGGTVVEAGQYELPGAAVTERMGGVEGGGGHQGQTAPGETMGEERQRLGGAGVQPVAVVDDEQGGAVACGGQQELTQAGVGEQSVGGPHLPGQRGAEGRTQRGGQVGGGVQDRADE